MKIKLVGLLYPRPEEIRVPSGRGPFNPHKIEFDYIDIKIDDSNEGLINLSAITNDCKRGEINIFLEQFKNLGFIIQGFDFETLTLKRKFRNNRVHCGFMVELIFTISGEEYRKKATAIKEAGWKRI